MNTAEHLRVRILMSAARDLWAACIKADAREELSELVDGSLLDRLDDVLKLLELEIKED